MTSHTSLAFSNLFILLALLVSRLFFAFILFSYFILFRLHISLGTSSCLFHVKGIVSQYNTSLSEWSLSLFSTFYLISNIHLLFVHDALFIYLDLFWFSILFSIWFRCFVRLSFCFIFLLYLFPLISSLGSSAFISLFLFGFSFPSILSYPFIACSYSSLLGFHSFVVLFAFCRVRQYVAVWFCIILEACHLFFYLSLQLFLLLTFILFY